MSCLVISIIDRHDCYFMARLYYVVFFVFLCIYCCSNYYVVIVCLVIIVVMFCCFSYFVCSTKPPNIFPGLLVLVQFVKLIVILFRYDQLFNYLPDVLSFLSLRDDHIIKYEAYLCTLEYVETHVTLYRNSFRIDQIRVTKLRLYAQSAY